MDLIKFTCKNFDRYFAEYTNYGIDVLIRMQMYFFYNIQPPQAKIYNPYQPIMEQNKSKFIRMINTNVNNSINNKYNNSIENIYNNNYTNSYEFKKMKDNLSKKIT
jgi:hypothetical protein